MRCTVNYSLQQLSDDLLRMQQGCLVKFDEFRIAADVGDYQCQMLWFHVQLGQGR